MKPANTCRHLRTKKMFIPALADEGSANEPEYGHSAHCWCNCTLTETGPDDQWVGADACKNSRPCFEQ